MSNTVLKTITEQCQGECPHCRSNNLDYGVVDFSGDNLLWFPFICDDCGASGHENYIMRYSESEADLEVEE